MISKLVDVKCVVEFVGVGTPMVCAPASACAGGVSGGRGSPLTPPSILGSNQPGNGGRGLSQLHFGFVPSVGNRLTYAIIQVIVEQV